MIFQKRSCVIILNVLELSLSLNGSTYLLLVMWLDHHRCMVEYITYLLNKLTPSSQARVSLMINSRHCQILARSIFLAVVSSYPGVIGAYLRVLSARHRLRRTATLKNFM